MTGMSSGRGRMSQAEVVQDRAADESGDCRDKVVVADELQGCGVGGGGGHYSPTHAQGLKHVVDGVTQPSPAGDGDVFGGRAALKGERAVAQRMGGAQGEDEPVVAHELVADLGRGGLAGSGFEVDVSSSRVMGVGTGFGHEAQTYSGCLGAQGVEQGWAGCRGQSVVPFQNESSLQGCQVDFWVGERTDWACWTRSCTVARRARARGWESWFDRCGRGSGLRWPGGCGPGCGSSRGRDMETGGGVGHAAFFQQSVERGE